MIGNAVGKTDISGCVLQGRGKAELEWKHLGRCLGELFVKTRDA